MFVGENSFVAQQRVLMNQESSEGRRPVATRDARWAQRVATWLLRRGLTPNQVSVMSAVFASVGAVLICLALRRTPSSLSVVAFAVGAFCIQLRLLCNLFDGMIAIEGGKKTPAGEIFNELPDRISDSVLFLGAAYGVGSIEAIALGWAASLFAMSTAYVRLLGVTAGAPSDFVGPFAKQHRMALLTLACVASAAAAFTKHPPDIMLVALAVIAAGSLLTAWRRLRRVVRALETGS